MISLASSSVSGVRVARIQICRCPSFVPRLIGYRNVCALVSAPDTPQVEPSSQLTTDSEASSKTVSSDEAKRRNEDALARVLIDFATMKATGKLAAAEEEDEDEIEGEEGEDWVWWRADDDITEGVQASNFPRSQGPPSPAAQQNSTGPSFSSFGRSARAKA